MRHPTEVVRLHPALLVGSLVLATGSISCRDDVLLGSLDTPPTGRLGPASRIPVSGQDWFLLGANLPWRVYGRDFGTSDGAASAAAQAELGSIFTDAANANIRVIRWHMFVDEIPLADGNDRFPQLVYDDLMGALALLEAQDLYADFVLFGELARFDAIIATDADRGRLARAVGDLVRAASEQSSRIVSWTLSSVVRIPLDQPLFVALASVVRANTDAYLSYGSGTPEQGRGLCDQGADFIGLVEEGSPCLHCTDYATLVSAHGFDCPIVVHTFFASVDYDPSTNLRAYYDAGFAGAFGWSLLPDRTTDGVRLDGPSFAAFAGAVADEGPR